MMPRIDIDCKTSQTALKEAKRNDRQHTPGPWEWRGEDYRGGWGWQMLVGPNGEGIIVGQGRDGGVSPHIRAGMPLDPALCVTGLEGHGKPRAECVHVFRKANACLIAAAPELLEALHGLLSLAGEWDEHEELHRARAAIAKANGGASC